MEQPQRAVRRQRQGETMRFQRADLPEVAIATLAPPALLVLFLVKWAGGVAFLLVSTVIGLQVQWHGLLPVLDRRAARRAAEAAAEAAESAEG